MTKNTLINFKHVSSESSKVGIVLNLQKDWGFEILSTFKTRDIIHTRWLWALFWINWFEGSSSATNWEDHFPSSDCISSNDFYPLPTMHCLLNTKPIALKNPFTVSATVASAEGSPATGNSLKHTWDWQWVGNICQTWPRFQSSVMLLLLDYIDLINELAAVSIRKVWL